MPQGTDQITKQNIDDLKQENMTELEIYNENQKVKAAAKAQKTIAKR